LISERHSATWLYKITVNECWDLLRKKKRFDPWCTKSDLSEEQARVVITAVEKENPGPVYQRAHRSAGARGASSGRIGMNGTG